MSRETQAAAGTPPVLKRAGVLGDVHAEDDLLDAALRHLARYDALDAVLCTGDVVTGPGDAGRCLALLRDAGALCVRGNHDRWFLEATRRQPGVGYDALPDATPDEQVGTTERAFLESAPVTRTFGTPAGRLLLCHGTGTDDMMGVYPDDSEAALAANHRLHRLYAEDEFRLMVSGHTHRRMLRAFGHLTLVNAGTLRRERQPGFLLLDLEARLLHAFDLSPETGAVVGERSAPLS